MILLLVLALCKLRYCLIIDFLSSRKRPCAPYLIIIINSIVIVMATASKPRTGAKTEEQVSLVVNYNARRENFKFFRSTVVEDALSEVAAKFKISEPHTKALLHNGHVMNEEATFGVSLCFRLDAHLDEWVSNRTLKGPLWCIL